MLPRIQRLAQRLLRYSFDLKYVPGKNQQVADIFSRERMRDEINISYLDNNLRIYSIITIPTENEKRLRHEIDQDTELHKIKYVKNG